MTLTIIEAKEKCLAFKGDTGSALRLTTSLRDAYTEAGMDMPKALNDFVFNIEVALQDAGVLSEDFEPINTDQQINSPKELPCV